MERNACRFFFITRFQIAAMAVFLSHLLASPLSFAQTQQFFRCPGSQGEVEFRRFPCAQGEGEEVLVEDRKSGWLGNSQRTLKQLLQKRAPAKINNRHGDSAKERQREKCWRVGSKLDRVQWQLRHGYKGSEGNQLRQQRKEYRNYLQQFCQP